MGRFQRSTSWGSFPFWITIKVRRNSYWQREPGFPQLAAKLSTTDLSAGSYFHPVQFKNFEMHASIWVTMCHIMLMPMIESQWVILVLLLLLLLLLILITFRLLMLFFLWDVALTSSVERLACAVAALLFLLCIEPPPVPNGRPRFLAWWYNPASQRFNFTYRI